MRLSGLCHGAILLCLVMYIKFYLKKKKKKKNPPAGWTAPGGAGGIDKFEIKDNKKEDPYQVVRHVKRLTVCSASY